MNKYTFRMNLVIRSLLYVYSILLPLYLTINNYYGKFNLNFYLEFFLVVIVLLVIVNNITILNIKVDNKKVIIRGSVININDINDIEIINNRIKIEYTRNNSKNIVKSIRIIDYNNNKEAYMEMIAKLKENSNNTMLSDLNINQLFGDYEDSMFINPELEKFNKKKLHKLVIVYCYFLIVISFYNLIIAIITIFSNNINFVNLIGIINGVFMPLMNFGVLYCIYKMKREQIIILLYFKFVMYVIFYVLSLIILIIDNNIQYLLEIINAITTIYTNFIILKLLEYYLKHTIIDSKTSKYE